MNVFSFDGLLGPGKLFILGKIKKIMKKAGLVLALIVLVFAFFIWQAAKTEDFNFVWGNLVGNSVKTESADEFTGLKYVSKIIDGDTVIIEGASVRLLGMDADEKGSPCWKAARDRITELVLDKQVDVVAEKNVNKDQYKRYLRYLFLNGTNIDLQLVKEGLAVARTEDSSYASQFVEAEIYARNSHIGCKWQNFTEN